LLSDTWSCPSTSTSSSANRKRRPHRP
jgi:hypothetical protein